MGEAQPGEVERVDEQNLQRRILDASLELIRAEGLASLSMREVARRAGVSHQAPYHHFADRETILARLAQEGFEELLSRMKAASAKARGLEERLFAISHAYVTFALDRPAHFRVMFRPELVEIERFPEAQCAGEAAFQELLAFVCELRGVTGAERTVEDDVWTSLLWSQVHGLACLLLDGPLGIKVPSSADRETHVSAVLRAVAKLVAASAARTTTRVRKAPPVGPSARRRGGGAGRSK